MKRKSLFICFAVCLISLLAVTVFAHPGRTDSNGGHTNHSTGEYHYHHGKSAHDHYDMDGDGIDDCPYNFVDTESVNSEYGSEENWQTAQTSSVKEEKTKKDIIREVIVDIAFVFPLWYFFSLLITVPVCKIVVFIFCAKDDFAKVLAIVSIIVFLAGIIIYYAYIK